MSRSLESEEDFHTASIDDPLIHSPTMTSSSCVPDLEVVIDISLDGFAEGYELLVFQMGTGFADACNIAGSELTVHQ